MLHTYQGAIMHEIFHSIVHALTDSIMIFPLLLVSYLIIEFIENKASKKFEKSSLLSGRLGPLFASIMGSVPQCGFSVVMTDFFSKKKIGVAALISIYLATSDEAFPILVSNGKIADLLILMITKFVVALIVGYIIYLITAVIPKKHKFELNKNVTHEKNDIEDNIETIKERAAMLDSSDPETHDHHHDHDEHEHEEEEVSPHLGCCGHHIENDAGEEKIDIMHIIVHSLKVFGFIVAVNFVMHLLIELVGTDSIRVFLESSSIFQPFIAGLVGLIPNCASSIIITELYIVGGLNFGAMVAGLCTNAGIAMVVLFKQNKNIKQNISILIGLYLISTLIGMLISFIPVPIM